MKSRNILILAGGVVALGLAMTHVSQAMDGFGWRGHDRGWGHGGPPHASMRHHGLRGGAMFGGPMTLFDMLDIDADSAVTITEAVRVPNQRFARLDANKDGFLTKEEIVGDRDGRRERMAERRFDFVDSDNDDRISVAEFEQPVRARFDVADADNDGRVTVDEFRRIMEDMHKFGMRGMRGMRGMMHGDRAEARLPAGADETSASPDAN